MSTNCVVVVTGGASGIGLGISRLFARNGHPVAMLNMQAEALDRESAILRQDGGRVLALTRSLARELAPYGITVNSIPPSLVDTPLSQEAVHAGQMTSFDAIAQMIPIARAGTPEDIAGACEYLCSDKASYVTGQQINVNGGSWM